MVINRITCRSYKGYGTETIRQVINNAKKSGKFDYIIIDYVPENIIAKHVYEKLGFQPTGKINQGEIVLKLVLNKSTED